MENRPDKHTYFLNIALSVADRSTCLRRRYGAVIVKDNVIVGTGYNGPASGVINCHDVGCVKDILGQKHYGSYEYCTAVHAEENSIINSDRSDRVGATMYIAGYDNENNLAEAEPCRWCKRKIINAKISQVVIMKANGNYKSLDPEEWKAEDTTFYIQVLNDARAGEIE